MSPFLKPLTVAAVLIAVPYISARAQSPQTATPMAAPQTQMLAAPIQSYQLLPFPITFPTIPTMPLGKCFLAPKPAVPAAWVGATAAPRQMVWGPTPIGSGLAWVGQKMCGLGNRHVWTIQHTKFKRVRQSVQPAAVYYMAVPAAPAAMPSAQHAAVQPVAPTGIASATPSDEAPPAPEVQGLVLPNPYSTDQPGPLRISRAPE